MASYLKAGLKYVWPFKSKSDPSLDNEHNLGRHFQPIIKFLGPWESSMVTLQSILIWEKPMKSALAVFATNLVYWYLVLHDINFLYGASMISLCAFVSHYWRFYIWPEICIPSAKEQEDWTPVHPKVFSVPEVGRYVEGTYNFILEQKSKLLQLRKKQPGLFCICMSFWFTLLGILGQSISGVKLLYGLLMTIMCGPAVFIHLLPSSFFVQFKVCWRILTGQNFMEDSNSSFDKELSDITEFIPEESSVDVQSALILPLTSDTAVSTEDLVKENKFKARNKKRVETRRSRTRNSSGLSSLTSGLNDSDFPSLGAADDSDLEESDLALPEMIPENPSQEDEMRFVQSHFGDSSSEDEEFSSGLVFKDSLDGRHRRGGAPPPTHFIEPILSFPTMEASSTMVDKLVGGALLTSLGQQLVSAMTTNVPATPHQVPPKRHSSSSMDEEFELISDDEIQ